MSNRHHRPAARILSVCIAIAVVYHLLVWAFDADAIRAAIENTE